MGDQIKLMRNKEIADGVNHHRKGSAEVERHQHEILRRMLVPQTCIERPDVMKERAKLCAPTLGLIGGLAYRLANPPP